MYSETGKKPRILLLSTAYLPMIGGSELAIKNITDRLPDIDFDLVTGGVGADRPAQERIGRVNVYRVGRMLANRNFILPKVFLPLAIAFKVAVLMIRNDYLLIHAYQASQAAGATVFIRALHHQIPILLTIQEGKDLSRQSLLTRISRRLIFLAADRFTVISNYLADYVRARTKSPIDIIPNGVDIDKFSVTSHQSPVTSHSATKTIISVSRLVPKNGLENLIRAMAHIKDKMSAKLVIIGSGPLENRLQELAESLQIAGMVEFRGSVNSDDLPRHLHSADVFVRPSLSEGLGSAFFEAMAAKVPVVASRVGGIADFLEDGKTGLVCDPSDPSDIADKIIKLLNDESLRMSLINNAWKMVDERYNWNVIAKDMRRVYASMSKSI